MLIITAVLCWFCTINEYDDDDDDGHGVGTRDGDTGNEDDSSFAGFLNLTNMPCSALPWHGGW